MVEFAFSVSHVLEKIGLTHVYLKYDFIYMHSFLHYVFNADYNLIYSKILA